MHPVSLILAVLLAGTVIGRLEQVERFFAAHGGKTIILGRFIGLVRALAPFIAGASRMPARRFIPYTTLAAGLWASSFCLLGYAFWRSLDQLIAITQQGTLALGAVIAAGFGALLFHRRLHARRRARTGRGGRDTPEPGTSRDPGWQQHQEGHLT